MNQKMRQNFTAFFQQHMMLGAVVAEVLFDRVHCSAVSYTLDSAVNNMK